MEGILYNQLQENNEQKRYRTSDNSESNKKSQRIYNEFCPVHGNFRFGLGNYGYDYGYGIPVLMPIIPNYSFYPPFPYSVPFTRKEVLVEEVRREPKIKIGERTEYMPQSQEEQIVNYNEEIYDENQEDFEPKNSEDHNEKNVTVSSNYLFYDANTGFRTEDRNRPAIKYEMWKVWSISINIINLI